MDVRPGDEVPVRVEVIANNVGQTTRGRRAPGLARLG
jgi:hypothetical protein